MKHQLAPSFGQRNDAITGSIGNRIGISSTYSNSFIPGTLWPMQVTAFFSSSAGDHRATGPKHLHTTQLQCGVWARFTIAVCTPNLLALNVNLKGILTYTYSIQYSCIWGWKKNLYQHHQLTIHHHSPSMAPVSKSQRSVASWTLSRRWPWSPAPRCKRAMFSVGKFSWGTRNLSRLVSCAKPHPGRMLGANDGLEELDKSSIKHGEG